MISLCGINDTFNSMMPRLSYGLTNNSHGLPHAFNVLESELVFSQQLSYPSCELLIGGCGGVTYMGWW